MAFWSDTTSTVPAPKRNFRWLLYLGGIPSWLCKKVTKPAYSITETVHEYLNHKFYYPGRLEWQTIDITLVDPVNPDAVATINEIIRFSGYTPPETQFDTMTLNKSDAVGALGRVRIQQLGTRIPGQEHAGAATGQVQHKAVEEWVLYNAWIKDVKYGELDYTSDDLTEVTLTLRYDFAKLNLDNQNVDIDLEEGAGIPIAPGTSPDLNAGQPESGIGGDTA
jgi:hypothetical protein|tara:strand:+ start:55111 stop:55776 length:666 start_codon:yes stop_codon:yes gene_type:complete